MKIIFMFVMLVFSMNAYSSCESSWNKAVSENAYGVKQSLHANKLLEKAKKMTSSANAEVCEQLRDTQMSSWLAGGAFRKAVNYWQSAYQQCFDERESRAKKQKRMNEKNLEAQSDFILTLTEKYSGLCGLKVLPAF